MYTNYVHHKISKTHEITSPYIQTPSSNLTSSILCKAPQEVKTCNTPRLRIYYV